MNYLSIGFSDFNEAEFLRCTCNDGDWNYFEKKFNEKWGSKPRTRYNLWHFIIGMKKGDLVIVPGSGVFSIYVISDDNPLTVAETELNDLKDWHGKN